MNRKILPLVKIDPWLEPNAADLEQRSLRYTRKLNEIEYDFGSLERFAEGYQYFGINYDAKQQAWVYREWAPGAQELYFFGDFNGWRRFTHPMQKNDYGVWEILLGEERYGDFFTHGSLVKTLVVTPFHIRERIPAYIRRVIQDPVSKNFTGQVWLPKRYDWHGDKFRLAAGTSLRIYECHPGMSTEKEDISTWKEFTDQVLPRIAALGYNAIQLMAVMEHPYYGSFGYHVSNFFAPSSRFGTPEDLRDLVREAHSLGMAVIMDLVHSHTVKNVLEGLNEFDGTEHQYFHPGERGSHPDWDSKLFDYGKTEVLRFLLSNVRYWLKEFRFDGFRFDGVGSMLYFHHGNAPIDDRAKYFTDGVEWDAITYLQLANTLVHKTNPHAITIAEDVTGMPGLCYPVKGDGIGFDYRLGMGIPDFWIRLLKDLPDEEWNIHEMWQVLNDRIPYVRTVAYCESHDQALVGDKTIAFRLMDQEMYFHMGIDDDNLVIDRGMALHKMIRLFTLSLGGHAWLNFMGNEFGHPEWIDFPREGNGWSFQYARRQWSLAENPELKYKFLLAFDAAMIRLARETKLLSGNFARQLNMDEENKTIIFEKEGLIFVFNWHPAASVPAYRFFVPRHGKYKLVLHSDDRQFGGHGRLDSSLAYFTIPDETTGGQVLMIYNTNRTVQVFAPCGEEP